MRWATRTGVHIDRAACAWLIRNYVDPQAECVFVTDAESPPAGTDEQTLLVADAVFAGLCEYFRRNLTTGRDPS